MIQLTAGDLLKETQIALDVKLLSDDSGLNNRITKYRIQKSGLVLTGLYHNIHHGRIQIFGQNEFDFFSTLDKARQKVVIEGIISQNIPCFVFSRNIIPPDTVIEVANKHSIPVFGTSQVSSTFIINVTNFLETNLTASTSLHGVLIDVLSAGVLITGKSGVGKSECALELILKGHRLVADDIVEVKKSYPSTIWGSCSPVTKHHMEIRGLGIINVAELFGVNAVRERKKIDLVIELVNWDGNVEYDRLGLERKTYSIMEVEIPLMTIPVSQGRNMAAIIEVAARNHILRERGIDSALSFREKLDARLIRERLQGSKLTGNNIDENKK